MGKQADLKNIIKHKFQYRKTHSEKEKDLVTKGHEYLPKPFEKISKNGRSEDRKKQGSKTETKKKKGWWAEWQKGRKERRQGGTKIERKEGRRERRKRRKEEKKDDEVFEKLYFTKI